MNIALAKEYYEQLSDIQATVSSVLTVVPASEPKIDIDLDSREITFPEEYKSFLSVATDHRAETVYFRVDRYFDGVDLSKYACIIEYINAENEGRIYPVIVKDLTSEAGKIIFGWCIGGEATKSAGTIKFSVRFYQVNPTTRSFSYSLSTIPIENTILNGIGNVSESEIYEYDSTLIEEIFSQLNDLQASKVYWRDV